jgi:hypothetical protein
MPESATVEQSPKSAEASSPTQPTQPWTPEIDTLPEVGVEAARRKLKLMAARDALHLDDLRQVLANERQSVAKWRDKIEAGGTAAEEDDMGGINIGDVYHVTNPPPAPQQPIAATIREAVAPVASKSNWLKTAAIVGLSVASGGGLAAAAPVALSWLSSKPAATTPATKFEAPNWDLEIVPQKPSNET